MGNAEKARRKEMFQWLAEHYPNRWVKIPNVNPGTIVGTADRVKVQEGIADVVVVHRNTRKNGKSMIVDSYVMVVSS